MPDSGRISAKTLSLKIGGRSLAIGRPMTSLKMNWTCLSDHRRTHPRKADRGRTAAIMQTSQTTIKRLESGKARPSTATLERIAKATNHKLVIRFIPIDNERP